MLETPLESQGEKHMCLSPLYTLSIYLLDVFAEDQEVLHGLAATQLLLLRQPLAPHLLVRPVILQSLLRLWKHMAACCIDGDHTNKHSCLVPGAMSIADGSLLWGSPPARIFHHQVM
jgi:hypothetical protein